jgi:hypothetical protein
LAIVISLRRQLARSAAVPRRRYATRGQQRVWERSAAGAACRPVRPRCRSAHRDRRRWPATIGCVQGLRYEPPVRR